MIVAQLCGGLGNQLFQYAAARALADRHRTVVKVDLSWFEAVRPGITARDFELGSTRARFERLSSAEELRRRLAFRIYRSRLSPACSAKVQRLLAGLSVFAEPHFHFCAEALGQPDDVVLVGYWQSERYFTSSRATLVRELVPRLPAVGWAQEAAERVDRSRNSIGLHVRRGDYVRSPTAAAFHGHCPESYYQAAVGMILDERPDGEVFVFSDDPEWCRAHLRLPGRVEVLSRAGVTDAITDLHLMARCRHQVISNSSFGWWAAWLAGGDDQIVVAPARWFRDDSIDVRDLIPGSWRRL